MNEDAINRLKDAMKQLAKDAVKGHKEIAPLGPHQAVDPPGLWVHFLANDPPGKNYMACAGIRLDEIPTHSPATLQNLIAGRIEKAVRSLIDLLKDQKNPKPKEN